MNTPARRGGIVSKPKSSAEAGRGESAPRKPRRCGGPVAIDHDAVEDLCTKWEQFRHQVAAVARQTSDVVAGLALRQLLTQAPKPLNEEIPF